MTQIVEPPIEVDHVPILGCFATRGEPRIQFAEATGGGTAIGRDPLDVGLARRSARAASV